MTNLLMNQAKYQLLAETRRSSRCCRSISSAKGPVLTVVVLVLGLLAGCIFVSVQLLRNIQYKSWYQISENASSWTRRAEFYAMASAHPGKNVVIPTEVESPSAQAHHPSRNFLKSNRSSGEPSQLHQHLLCYYALHDDNAPNPLQPEDIDPFLCTHIIIAFAFVENCTLQPIHPEDVQTYKKVVALKEKNPALKVMISAGQMSSTGGFKDLVISESNRKRFARSAANFLTENKLDGLDLDWEFPEWPPPGEQGAQRAALSSLLYTLRFHLRSGRRRLLLSVAVGAPKAIADVSYDVPFMARYVDFVNLMTYDFHSYVWYLPVTGHNAPLFPNHLDKGLFATLNTNWSANYWHQLGMPRRKIQIGIPTYAHTFRLINPDNNGIDAPAIGFGSLGFKGFAYLSEVCNFTSQPGTTARWDDDSKVPYAFNGYDWVSYDNASSVELKAALVKSQNYGGAMVWSIGHDDHTGACGQGRFPLLQQIKQVLGLRHADLTL